MTIQIIDQCQFQSPPNWACSSGLLIGIFREVFNKPLQGLPERHGRYILPERFLTGPCPHKRQCPVQTVAGTLAVDPIKSPDRPVIGWVCGKGLEGARAD